MAIVAPLLGLAFAFDAINGERSEGTLPRLLAQPIYRDDVINGKFAAGLAVIGIVLVAVIGIIAGFGIFRLGIVPGVRRGRPPRGVDRWSRSSTSGCGSPSACCCRSSCGGQPRRR